VGLTITKQELAELEKVNFEGEIYIIDHPAEVDNAVAYLSTKSALGFDTETKLLFMQMKALML
jgi:ribonuclease D